MKLLCCESLTVKKIYKLTTFTNTKNVLQQCWAGLWRVLLSINVCLRSTLCSLRKLFL